MAEETPVVRVKIELDNGLDNDPTISIGDPNYLASSNTPALPLWKLADGTLLQQVEVLEQSLSIAVPQLQELRSRLHNAALARKRQCRITAGAVGATGMGKSTVWNAVLGFRELLPTDNGQACTSTIIEVAWNPSKDPQATFQAKIVFLQMSDWQAELDQLYLDIDALARKDRGTSDDDGGIDTELETRIDAIMDKVRAVYPHIDSRQDLERTSVAKLMKHENVADLGKERTFCEASLLDFAPQIRKFLVSSIGKGKFAPWPLVKLAQIFVKAELLKDGLVLVDFPGNQDTNTARNSLCQEYQKKLSVHCILSASKRAASDQTAQVTLNETYQRHLQLDGQWKANRIIFVVVRTDESITVEDHLLKNPEVGRSLERILEKEQLWATRKSTLEREIREVKASNSKKCKLLSSQNKEIRKLHKWLNSDSNFKDIPRPIRLKGGSEVLARVPVLGNLSDSEKAKILKLAQLRNERIVNRKLRNDESNTIIHKQSELKRLELWLSKATCIKTRACIEHRSKMQKMKIREYFNRIFNETGNTTSVDVAPLPVICVSASKYLDLVDNKPPSLGFPDQQYTEIPNLRRALRDTTLENRYNNAKTTLKEFEAIVLSVQSWAKSLDSNYHMTPKQRLLLEEKFETETDGLIQEFSQHHHGTTDAITKSIDSSVVAKLRPIQLKASKAAPNIADSWVVQLHWATYRATVGKLGEFRSSTRKEPISFNEDLAGAYTTPMIPMWTDLFDSKLPQINRQNTMGGIEILLQFSQRVIASAQIICPEINPQLQSLKDSILHLQPAIEEMYTLIWDEKISATRSSSYRRLKPQIQKSLTPVYQEAVLERGKGFRIRMAEIIRQHLKRKAAKMYEVSTNTLKSALDRMVVGLKHDLEIAPDNLIAQIRDHFSILLDNHKPTNIKSMETLAAIKKRLLNDVVLVIANLDASLLNNVQIPMQEVEEQPAIYDVDEMAIRAEGDESGTSDEAMDSDSDSDLDDDDDDDDDDEDAMDTT